MKLNRVRILFANLYSHACARDDVVVCWIALGADRQTDRQE